MCVLRGNHGIQTLYEFGEGKRQAHDCIRLDRAVQREIHSGLASCCAQASAHWTPAGTLAIAKIYTTW